MTSLTRRETLAATIFTTLAAAMPAWAQDATTAAAPGAGAAWDLGEIYPSDAAWDDARKAALAGLPALARYRGKLGDNARTMAAALVAQSDAGRTIARIYTYISLKADADLRVSANQQRQAQAIDLYTAYGEATSWVAPEILALGQQKVEKLHRRRCDPEIALRLLPARRPAPGAAYAVGRWRGAARRHVGAVPGPAGHPRPAASRPTSPGRRSPCRPARQSASTTRPIRSTATRRTAPTASSCSTPSGPQYGKFQNALGAAYLSHVKADIFAKKARKYPTSLAQSLSNNNVPETVYRALVAETNTGLPQLHRYFELRRRLLKLPDMAYYDIYPPLVSLDRKVTVPEMRTTVLEAVKPLGPDYVALLGQATAGKWMDPLPRPGKKSGAYMNPGAYDVHPYLLLNLGENYDGMTTFAHEWGHAMHSLLANKAQVYDKADYPLFLAEIASTCNEQLLAAYMVARARTKEEKLFYLGQQLEGIRGTFYRQAMFAEFELAVHDKAEAGEGLSGEAFTALYLDLVRRYHGPKVRIDPAYAVEWAYIPHFYNSFYVYQYATSISAASYFARAILKGGATERDNYLNVLKSGGSDYPVDILKRAGLDMASAAPYQAIIATFKDTLDQAEALMG